MTIRKRVKLLEDTVADIFKQEIGTYQSLCKSQEQWREMATWLKKTDTRIQHIYLIWNIGRINQMFRWMDPVLLEA